MVKSSKQFDIEVTRQFDIEVTRATYVGKRKSDRILFFDMIVNGVKIYGCRVIEGKKDDFIAFPSKKNEKDNKYYNHVWIELSEDDTEEIIKQAKKLAD